MVFWIDDDAHCEAQKGEYATYADALAQLERFARTPWGEAPNLPPCSTGLACEREWRIYEAVGGDEYVQRGPSLVVDARGARWVESRS